LPLIFKIRKQYTAQELPIIMLTSAVDKVSIGKFHESGVNTAVRKIPQADQFHDLVYRMLRKPWVDVPEVTVGDAHLLTWTTAEGTHVFCPNLQLLKVAATPEVALAMMQEALAKHLASQGSVPAIGSPKLTVTYPGKKVASGNVTEMPAVTPVPDAVGQ
jgi:predicted RNase H-like HicB family nuclease